MILNELYTTILQRRDHPNPESYTARLFAAGRAEIAKKVGEEAIEVILAASAQTRQRLIEEVADLAYHTLVLMAEADVTPEDVAAELAHRRR